MGSDFAHLHVHTQYSLLDSAIRVEELFEKAAEYKLDAVAMTDHGNLFGAVDFFVRGKEAGVKPIIGCEVYLAPGSRLIKGTFSGGDDELAPYSTSRSGMHHLILLCQNEIGYRNLCKLVSSGYLEGFYYKPRIDKDILKEHAEGLIATTACLKGELASQALVGDMDRLRETAKWYQATFPGRFYLELQQNGLPQQMVVNQRFLELSEELKIPVIATADCHYLKREDAPAQEVLMAIQTGKVIEDPTQVNIPSDEFYLKPPEVMKEEFSGTPQAIANTAEIARQCNFEFRFNDDKGKKIYHFPKFDPPQGKTQADHLNQLAHEGLEKRFYELEAFQNKEFTEETKKTYVDRLDRELAVINQMGFTGYFLIVADFIKFAKDHDIPVGPGRGSGAGSLVAYSLRITELDPLEHDLLFERFLNPERVSLPDFDVDFCMDKRDKVIEYVCEKYGKECVAQIITFGKLQARGVIRDVGRVFGLPVPEVDRIAKLVPETLNITLEEAFQQEPRLGQLTNKDPKIHKLFNICRSLEGLLRHASIHAAGLVISNKPMVEHCPLYRGKNDELVIQFDMNNADRVGLIKFDFLGLKTLTFLQRAEELVNTRHTESHFELSRISLKDKLMYELLSKGDTFGIFQLESSGMQDLLRKIHPDRFDDLVAINALYRPGPMVQLPDYISRRIGETQVVYEFENLRPILENTCGIIVYQEQVQQIAMTLASYTAGGADILRRAMGKKKPEEMAKQKAIFMEGAVKNGFDKDRSLHIFELMEKFAGYGFNKSHSAAYCLVTCQTAFLKAHFTVEFYAALLSIERESTDKITKYIADAKRHTIEVKPPDINESETDFTVLSEHSIRFGLGAIKGVGQIAIDSVLEARKQNGPFKDLYDLCTRANTQKVNKRVIEAFVKAGALDSFGVNRASLMKAIDEALSMGSSLQKIQDEKQADFSDLLGEEEHSFSQRKITYPNEKPWPRLQELQYEKETTGFFLTGHPLDDFKTELSKYTTATIQDCLSQSSAKEVLVGVQVVSLREIFTRRGDRMAFATLEDTTGQMDCIIFSDVYLENESAFKFTEPLWIHGQVETAEGGNKLILSKKSKAEVLPLRYAFESMARELHLYLPAIDAAPLEKKLANLQDFLRKNPPKAGCPLFLHFQMEGAETTLKMKEAVALNRDTVNWIHSLLGEERYRIDFR